jgi:pyrimidine operon attenuation protein/uracil phosphoribosyltransferase
VRLANGLACAIDFYGCKFFWHRFMTERAVMTEESLRKTDIKTEISALSSHSDQSEWKVILDHAQIARAISRMSYEIVERDRELTKVAIVGIRTGGEFLGRRIQERIREIEGIELPFGVIDITLYRDDILETDSLPILRGTDLPFSVSGCRIVLVDDVLFTGRTVRAALDAIIDFGRPKRVELAVLVDRGHREFPIRPDYVGKNIPTSYGDSVKLQLIEGGSEKDVLYLVEGQRDVVAPT